MTRPGRILVIDTATTRAVIALGEADGTLVAQRGWVAGYRHGEELLARIEGLLAELGQAPAALGGVVVGTGPGAFTGLRVGIATAKGLAHALGLEVVGVPTSAALLAAAADAADAERATRAGWRRAWTGGRPRAPPARRPVGSRPEPAGGGVGHPARRHGPRARPG